jgi:predicted small secreted protein
MEANAVVLVFDTIHLQIKAYGSWIECIHTALMRFSCSRFVYSVIITRNATAFMSCFLYTEVPQLHTVPC